MHDERLHLPYTTPCIFTTHPKMIHSSKLTLTCIGTLTSHPSLSKIKSNFSSHVLSQVMSECYCMHVVVQYPSFVVLASLECLGLFLRGDIESLVVDAFETAYDYCISFLLCLKNTLVQIDILYIHFLSIDYHFASNTLRCIVYDMFLIDQTVHLRSQSHKLRDAMSIVFFLDYWTRQLLVEIEER